MQTIENQINASEAAIFTRLLENGQKTLNRTAARFILSLAFNDNDKARMHDLAVKNQEGNLSPEEWRELENYLRVGNLLSILQSKARMALNNQQQP
jgi:hypothetical protein